MTHIVYVAGKSGGHIIPALTLAAQEQAAGNQVSIIALDRPLDRHICEGAPHLTKTCFLRLSEIRAQRAKWWYLWYVCDLLRAVCTCIKLLRACHATQLVSMGGYISVPAVIAARMLGIPITMYELNAEPGTAVKWLARFVHRVYYCVAAARAHLPTSVICEQVAYPVRYTPDARVSSLHARAQYGIAPDAFVFFVLGGSQGSQRLNHLMIALLRQLSLDDRQRISIIHQTGDACAETVRMSYRELGVTAHVFAFCDDLAPAYCAADCVITRAGAGALHEIHFFQRPAIIIPLEISSTMHQLVNAQAFVAEHPHHYTIVHQHEDVRIMEAFTRAYVKTLSIRQAPALEAVL
jgi:UDP-N-acetylglucosamine--N-acetylmuramyl-(pentapeptide) pyrophosphoryl-undecaprenol N-acetylglucosamine transferase